MSTRTYHFTDINSADTAGSDFNKTAEIATPGAAVTLSKTNITGGTSNLLIATFSTTSGEPNLETWPAGTYNVKVDVTTVGADVSYYFVTRRVLSDYTVSSTFHTSSTFTTAAFQEYSFSLGSDSIGNSTDLLQVCVFVSRAASHSNQTFAMRIGQSGSLSLIQMPTPDSKTFFISWANEDVPG